MSEETVDDGTEHRVLRAIKAVRHLEEPGDTTREGGGTGDHINHLGMSHNPQIPMLLPERALPRGS